MTFRISTDTRPNSLGLDPTTIVLHAGDHAQAEIWPAYGFNCFRWIESGHDLLYADPHIFDEYKPTRSGLPILFPFPNRIRDGKFTWEGKEYQLPLNDPTGKNAIHGFACRKPWRVIEQGASETEAWVTGEFHGSQDAPESLPLWPTDYRIRVRIGLGNRLLRIEALIDEPGGQALPFGLGYHPYFRVTPHSMVQVPADEYWVLSESLPTKRKQPVDVRRDLRKPRAAASLELDDILTQVNGSCRVGDVLIEYSRNFTEVVVFTPPHRQAVCVEPYTCITDAINLGPGWRTLAPGQVFSSVVQMTWSPQ